ncbi:DUF1778 domain-containing protein [Thalassobaculum sp.]|uniref:type II toxin-antitoxin system TacA family antitoxin n=1 Tax=Thalassobaculum sp. TaxID=2022740 RepID=UPI003B5CAD62
MAAYDDETQAKDERRTARMNFRTQPRVKEAIQRAAAISGVDDSVFAMNAAYRAALDTIQAHERTVLTQADRKAFLDALDAPAEPTQALKEAFARHRKTVVAT